MDLASCIFALIDCSIWTRVGVHLRGLGSLVLFEEYTLLEIAAAIVIDILGDYNSSAPQLSGCCTDKAMT